MCNFNSSYYQTNYENVCIIFKVKNVVNFQEKLFLTETLSSFCYENLSI